jgi:NAD(P)-dependent dehydrogenase (short-subunit alcohol dehydrogenase family)
VALGFSPPYRSVYTPGVPSVFQPRLLVSKTAVVTGGGSGINLAIAERFAEHGADLLLLGRKIEKLEAARDQLAHHGTRVEIASADVRDYNTLEAAIAGFSGVIDIVVCGAAGNFPAYAADMTANGFKAVVDIDLLGTFNTARAAWTRLRKPGACILAISATHGSIVYPAQAHVCAAKSGVDMLIRSLALEWGPSGVRANGIAPGPIDDTEGMRRLAPSDDDRARVQGVVPLRRMGTKDEIADLALFLVSDAARYITGAIIPCDGGATLAGPAMIVR